MKAIKIFFVVLLLTVLFVFLSLSAYAIYMGTNDTGFDCRDVNESWIRERIEALGNRRPSAFNMDGFNAIGDKAYIEGSSGDIILLHFMTSSGMYRARITCDGGVDVDTTTLRDIEDFSSQGSGS